MKLNFQKIGKKLVVLPPELLSGDI